MELPGRGMSLLISETLNIIKEEFKKSEPEWSFTPMTEDDILFLTDECNKDSEFDPENFRKTRLQKLLNGEAPFVVAKCTYGQVFVIFDDVSQTKDIPWGLWARIMRLYSEKRKIPFKVFFLANTQQRQFPPGHDPIRPQNINGGYTYRCNRETILIYRAEDATRVLIHELMHSCCLDDPKHNVDIMEAETEAWAEFIYIAFLSQGQQYIFNDLLQRQSEWMRKQNKEVKKHMVDPLSHEFPWRYTIGKQEVWERWGILRENDVKPYVQLHNSLRLTYPPATTLKTEFKVRKESTIL